MSEKTDLWVYADWQGMSSPVCIGILSAQQAKGKKAFSFSYQPDWIKYFKYPNTHFIHFSDRNQFVNLIIRTFVILQK